MQKKSWTEQRQEWNENGQCAREACRGDITGMRWFNSGSRLYYCETCAERINKHNPDLCTVDLDYAKAQIERILDHSLKGFVGKFPSKEDLEANASAAIGMMVRFPDYDEATGTAQTVEVCPPVRVNYIKIELLLEEKSPTLIEALAARGYTTSPGTFHGQKKILAGDEVVFEGTAHDVWHWLNDDE